MVTTRTVCAVFYLLNRSQRLLFDVSSPNGILLFRETSKMITTYGTDFPLILWHRESLEKKNKQLVICYLNKPVASIVACREPDPDVGRSSEGPGVWGEAEGGQRVFHHAEGGAQRELRQLRSLPAIRRRRSG